MSRCERAQKKYLGWSDQEIKANREFLRKDAEFQWELQQIGAGGPDWRDQEAAAPLQGGAQPGLPTDPETPPDFGGGPAELGADAAPEVAPIEPAT